MMMNQRDTNYCQDLLPYLVNDLPDQKRNDFERHLNECSNCREELKELQVVWDSLPMSMEEVDPPGDLKSQVFSSLFPSMMKQWKPWINSGFGKIAIVLFLLLTGVTWNNMQLRGQLAAIQEEMSSPAKVIQTYTMVAADPNMQGASGNAWVLQSGEQKKLVVHLNGLASTIGEQAYQVWIIHNGQRLNAGTFRVDEKGRGMLTYHFSDPNMQFESIGITLEPDPYGNQPRGKKVSGTI
jgi:hypothetical protein